MENIVIYQPERLFFGEGSYSRFVHHLNDSGMKRLYVLTIPYLREQLNAAIGKGLNASIQYRINDSLNSEPCISDYDRLTEEARSFQPDGIIGIGGGSVLDLSKILAAMLYNNQKIEDVFGIGLLKERKLFLACLPTTSGTGSEVSPNAILMDEGDGMKKGIISPYLVPDIACIDPLLTSCVPPDVTASTGMDALTHCIEAFANRFAHPLVDLYALEGIRLISENLARAYQDGSDRAARTALSMGSYYGGLCLGPVNTGAVHALSYPLGSRFRVPHGLANALLLPYVLEFNLSAAPERYARVAMALGVKRQKSDELTARAGVSVIRKLMQLCKLPDKLSQIGIPDDAIPEMAVSAVAIQRLMKNNLRKITAEDAITIYQKAF